MKAFNSIVYEFEKDEKVYRFELPHGAKLADAYEAASVFLEEMVNAINSHVEQLKPKEDCCDEEKNDEGSEEDQESSS